MLSHVWAQIDSTTSCVTLSQSILAEPQVSPLEHRDAFSQGCRDAHIELDNVHIPRGPAPAAMLKKR